jgi:hypothetical protein
VVRIAPRKRNALSLRTLSIVATGVTQASIASKTAIQSACVFRLMTCATLVFTSAQFSRESLRIEKSSPFPASTGSNAISAICWLSWIRRFRRPIDGY